jgi:hypothetical protein
VFVESEERSCRFHLGNWIAIARSHYSRCYGSEKFLALNAVALHDRHSISAREPEAASRRVFEMWAAGLGIGSPRFGNYLDSRLSTTTIFTGWHSTSAAEEVVEHA